MLSCNSQLLMIVMVQFQKSAYLTDDYRLAKLNLIILLVDYYYSIIVNIFWRWIYIIYLETFKID